jgi:hypothetical protein
MVIRIKEPYEGTAHDESLPAFDLDYFTSGVMPAIWAYPMGDVFLAAICADEQVLRFQGMMSSASVATTLRYFSFW